MIGGFTALAARHGVHVAGGNLTRSPGPLLIDVTVSGGLKRRQVLTRGGARPGDELYVTGSLGAAAAGLQMLKLSADASGECARRYLYPEPRLRTGLLLGRNRAASACIDLSDGLADGVHHIAEPERRRRHHRRRCRAHRAGGQGVVRRARRGPHDIGHHRRRRLRTAVHREAAEPAAASKPPPGTAETPLTRIGVCTADRAVVLRCGAGAEAGDRPIPSGYSHFR